MVPYCKNLVLQCVETEDVCKFLQEAEQESSTDNLLKIHPRRECGTRTN